jgi:hypothetical protein
VKVVSQRKTLAVDHHHPLRPLAPLGLADREAPFWAGAKLPSRKDSLEFICWRSLSSPRKVRQIFSQTSCSSQSRSLRQQVEGEGNSSGKSCQRAPLRKIHKMPSSTLRSAARGRPPRGRDGRLGSNGRSFSHWASVNNRPYRAIGPSSGANHSREPPPRDNNYPKFTLWYRVLKWLGSVDILVPTRENLSAPALRKGPFARRQQARWAEVGLLAFARTAWEVGRAVLAPYRTPFSKHQFTQPQLPAVLCLMRYEDWTFREAEVRLREHRELRQTLGLSSVPDFTTLYRFLKRVEEPTLVRAVGETVRRLPRVRSGWSKAGPSGSRCHRLGVGGGEYLLRPTPASSRAKAAALEVLAEVGRRG